MQTDFTKQYWMEWMDWLKRVHPEEYQTMLYTVLERIQKELGK